MLLEQVLRDAFRDAYQYADSAMLPVIEPFLAVKPKIKNLLLHTYRHFADFSRQFFLLRPHRVVRFFLAAVLVELAIVVERESFSRHNYLFRRIQWQQQYQ